MVPLRLYGVQLIRIKSRKLAGLVSLASIFKNRGHNFQMFVRKDFEDQYVLIIRCMA